MSINKILSEHLSSATYNFTDVKIPDRSNIFMGIGLWSKKDGLSEGLPIDVMHMLLGAALMRLQIAKESSRIILLIADSMAIREGAEGKKVFELVQLYKKSLEPLLALLNIKENSEIILSSDLEKSKQYEESLKLVEDSPVAKQLQSDDPSHYAYIRTQTAINHYMNTHLDVGIKVGWICAESAKQSDNSSKWDELKFDRWCKTVFSDSNMQYLYAKAGLKQPGSKCISVSEGCPYTAYAKDQRYVVQTQSHKDIKTICFIQKRVAAHWKGVAEICSNLMEMGLVNCKLLPKDCIQKTNAITTVYNMLNHWVNAPIRAIYEDPCPVDTYREFAAQKTSVRDKSCSRCMFI